MPLPPPVRTIQQILIDLNGEGRGLWHELPGNYLLLKVDITGFVVNSSASKEVLVLKAFANMSTAEVRTYIAKYTDDPERYKLYPPS